MFRTESRTKGPSALGALRPGEQGPFGRRPEPGEDHDPDDQDDEQHPAVSNFLGSQEKPTKENTVTDQPMAILGIDGRPTIIHVGPIEPGTKCGKCSAVSGGSDGIEAASIKVEDVGILCGTCSDSAVPGLSAVLGGVETLVNGLNLVRLQNRALLYETLSGQILAAIRGIAASIGAEPAFHEAPIQIGRLTDRDTGEHQFFWAAYASEWDQFAAVQRDKGGFTVEPFEFDDPRIVDATAEWLAEFAREKGEPTATVMVGSIEKGRWVNWNLDGVPRPPVPTT